ncbi:hypothetical protein LIA77_04191 [Sarocladium implicatum]|nr:hypothetical protein LIA77_04191 [Sarocladium implicatum]
MPRVVKAVAELRHRRNAAGFWSGRFELSVSTERLVTDFERTAKGLNRWGRSGGQGVTLGRDSSFGPSEVLDGWLDGDYCCEVQWARWEGAGQQTAVGAAWRIAWPNDGIHAVERMVRILRGGQAADGIVQPPDQALRLDLGFGPICGRGGSGADGMGRRKCNPEY